MIFGNTLLFKDAIVKMIFSITLLFKDAIVSQTTPKNGSKCRPFLEIDF